MGLSADFHGTVTSREWPRRRSDGSANSPPPQLCFPVLGDSAPEGPRSVLTRGPSAFLSGPRPLGLLQVAQEDIRVCSTDGVRGRVLVRESTSATLSEELAYSLRPDEVQGHCAQLQLG